MQRPPFGGRTLGMWKESMRRTCHGKKLRNTSRRRVFRDSRRRGLNPQDLITIGRIIGWAFLPEVCINRISPPIVEINLLDQPQERLITQRKNPWNVRVVEKNIYWETVCTDNRTIGEFTTFKKLPSSMTWPGVCHKFMQSWIIKKPTTKLQWWRWKV